jgi:outer membrane autotransporter protein
MMVGYDTAVSKDWLVGGVFSYVDTNWNADTHGVGSGKIRTPLAMLYARYAQGPWSVRLNTGMAFHGFDTTRTVDLGSGAPSFERSSHDGREWSMAGEVDYGVNAGAWEIRPLAGLRYARLSEDGFTESGGTDTALTVASRSASNAEASVGARFLRPLSDKSRLELKTTVSHLFGDTDVPVTASLAGQPGGFTTYGSPLRRDALNLAMAVGGEVARDTSVAVQAGYQYRGAGQQSYGASLWIRRTF